MTAPDALAISLPSAPLSEQVPAAEITERLALFYSSGDHGCFVAVQDGVVVGWVDVLHVQMLISPRFFAEIGASS